MAVPTTMTDLSTTAASNSPAGSDYVGPLMNDYMQAAFAIIRTTNAKGANIASATTTDIGAATAEVVDVTGTTTITGLGTIAAGIRRVVRFTGALTLTHNGTSLILPGSANITTANGDVFVFRSLGSGNWICEGYVPIAGYFTAALAHTFTAAQRGSYTTLTDAATIAIDLSANNFFKVLLGGNRTLGVPTNIVEGQSGQIDVYQDGTGSRTLAYSWVYQFASGTAPTLTTGKYTKDELAYTVNLYKTSTITVTIATPGVVSWTAHGLYGGQKIQMTTTGALPTGLTVDTSYYVIPVGADSFQLATSLANAQAGTAIATSGSQSGVHTMVAGTITIAAIGAVQ